MTNDAVKERRDSSETVLQVEGLEKSYSTGPEKLHILRGISFELAVGDTLVVTGESGSGKSTLLNLIGGLDYPSAGRITAGGYRVERCGEEQLTQFRNRVVGFIFQFHYLLRDFTALENVMLPAFMAGLPKKRAVERARRLLTDVRLEDRMEHYPTQLSGGERQRVAVARSLINEPELLLADEPTGNLDEYNSRVVEDLLFSLVNDYEKTLIVVTHDQAMSRRAGLHYHLHGGHVEEQ
jgi:lipoprotein-releasing system ATP-binding protein